MKVYAVNDATGTALSIGHIQWFADLGLQLPECDEEQIVQVCRPGDNKKIGSFDSYITMMKEKGPLHFEVEADVPETFKKQSGFWEANGIR